MTVLRAVIVLAGTLLLFADRPAHAGFTVDGNLSDWGVAVATGTNPQPVPGAGATGYSGVAGRPGLLAYMVEDTNDANNNYEVGPNWGGQNYDAEFLGVGLNDNGQVVIGILSGQRFDNGQSLYAPGDIRITTGSGRIVGIEVGGGWKYNGTTHGSVADNLVTLGEAGVTYKLDSNGFTVGATDGNSSWGNTTGISHNVGSPPQSAGSIWVDGYWINDPINPPTPTQLKTGQFVNGTKLGDALSYNYRFVGNGENLGEHSVIELAFNLGLFDSLGGITAIDWSPSCGNDTLHVNVMLPEPTSLAAWGLLPLAGLAYRWRRRRSK